MSQGKPVDVLWTGGWDSTYRVLELLLVWKAEVQPHYLIDVERLSTRQEIRAMMQVRSRLAEVSPDAASRLRPVAFMAIAEIAPNAAISQQYMDLRSKFALGSQYDWLNRYAVQEGITGLEIGFQKNDDADHFESLRRHVIPNPSTTNFNSWVLPADHGDFRLSMFERFSFPVLWKSKSDMKAEAQAEGFLDILELSWFCHYPIMDSACGCCNTCRHVMDAGFAYRFTPLGRLRNKIWMIVHPLRLLFIRPASIRKGVVERRRWRKATSV